ncbi:F-box protein At3g49450 [Eutrema salsugineum]|uniref:F-box protein At3g49450 n=1 Tax=Eutrema salsugineum TaxID=72664 RepID=UPI000CED3EFC|nr:F-box protein At3g49450 [Eutrema salsugineum]
MDFCSTSVEYSSEQIPIDILIEIFLRLPAKSILRFRCVSKQWASILCRPDFTDLFLTFSSDRPRLLFTFQVDGKWFFFSAPQRQDPDQNLSHDVIIVDNHMRIPTRMCSFWIHRPVRGLVFPKGVRIKRGCNDSKAMVICNPVLTVHNNTQIIFTRNRQHSGEHQVLTLGTGKLSWRMIECSLHQLPDCDGICIDGVFVTYPLTLMNYKGELGAIQFNMNGYLCGRSTSLELRVLDDAEKHKWSVKTYILSLFWKDFAVDTSRYYHFVGMTDNSELVFSPFIISDPFYIFYYNLGRNTTVRVRIHGIEFVKNQYIYTFLNHVDDVKPMYVSA